MAKLTNKQRRCRKKKIYLTQAEAEADVAKFMACNGLKLKPYLCEVCGNIHLTKGVNYEDIKL